MTTTLTTGRASTGLRWAVLLFLIGVVLVFAAIRISVDWPNLARGTLPPEESFDHRYAAHPVLAYAHILPGVVYLLGAPFQLSRRFRRRHMTLHRRMGRILLPVGIVAGLFGIVFGALFAWGERLEASASILFGVYFVVALVIAFRAVRNADITRHRRWMIRAFAIGLAVGSIRIWLGVFQGFGLLSFQDSLGVAFWLSFSLHAVAAEAYLRRRPLDRR